MSEHYQNGIKKAQQELRNKFPNFFSNSSFKEEDHPRDGGKFAKKEGTSSKDSSFENGKDWMVVIAYDCNLGPKGTVMSRHATYELARVAAKRSGYDDFLAIKDSNGN